MTDPAKDAGGPQYVADQVGPSQPESNPDARMWAMFCHLAALAGFLPMIPLFGFAVGPAVVWLIKRGESPFIDAHGKESLNFQLSMVIYATVLAVTCVGVLLWPVLLVADVVLLVLGALKANDGLPYRYPLTIRFIT
jgi:hypothetical protein